MTSPSAVAPRVPSATALTASSLRRVPRRSDSISRRAYIALSRSAGVPGVRAGPGGEEVGSPGEIRGGEDEISPLDPGRQGDRLAPAGLADARRVDHRAAVQTGDVGAV